jgi:RNA polymerase sigma factor (sigma-70 family)
VRFPSTRRSAVFASRSDDEVERRRGFESLIEAYWKPVYKLLRMKWGVSPDDAADLTQGFFAQAMEKDFFRGYDPAKGSFRTFLRACLDGYVANQQKSAARLKRGGGVSMISLDFTSAEGEFRDHPPAPGADPEELFHREWVRNMFALALEDLRVSCEEAGKQIHYRLLERYDIDPDERASYAGLAAEFSLTAATVTNYLAWARREFRRLLVARLRDVSGGDEDFRSGARLLGLG